MEAGEQTPWFCHLGIPLSREKFPDNGLNQPRTVKQLKRNSRHSIIKAAQVTKGMQLCRHTEDMLNTQVCLISLP